MIKYFQIRIVAICLFSASYISAQDTWVQKDSVNGSPKSSVASFVLDGDGWFVSGLGSVDFSRKMYSYDVGQDDWDNELSIGGLNGSGLNRGSAVGFSVNGKGYVGLGQGNFAPFYSDLWEYDPVLESWSQKADFMGSARRQAVAFTVDNIAYVGTGQDQGGYTNDFYKYNSVTNTWSQVADFGGSARKGAVGFKMGASGYVGTGDDGIYTNDFWEYQPIADIWVEKATFPGSNRSGASGWGIFPSGFIACGYDATLNYKKDVWQYNYYNDTWSQKSDFIGPKRTNASAFVIDGIAYLGMGYNGLFLDDFYAYTPALSLNEYSKFIANVFPNPATTQVTLTSNYEFDNKQSVKIYDLRGRWYDVPVEVVSTTKLTIDVSKLSSGVYVYELLNENTQKFYGGKIIVK